MFDGWQLIGLDCSLLKAVDAFIYNLARKHTRIEISSSSVEGHKSLSFSVCYRSLRYYLRVQGLPLGIVR